MSIKEILPRSFYERNTLEVARNLLGKSLVRGSTNGTIIKGIIVETEAYRGFEDKACHAHKGKTPRCGVMYGPAGFAYVYFTYGMHFMLNIVTETRDYPAAVLIRAIEPTQGQSEVIERRKISNIVNCTNGPGKLTKALLIDKSLNGCDITIGKNLWVEDGENINDTLIGTGPRIGVDYAEEAKDWPWRFFIKNNNFVSKR